MSDALVERMSSVQLDLWTPARMTWWADCFECYREWPVECTAGSEPVSEADCPFCGGVGAVIFSTWRMPKAGLPL